VVDLRVDADMQVLIHGYFNFNLLSEATKGLVASNAVGSRPLRFQQYHIK
jgi:hypothetical protein